MQKRTETSLKIFLTSGLTITITENEVVETHGRKVDLPQLVDEICYNVENGFITRIKVSMVNKYIENDVEKTQDITHYYNIPHDKISWYMIEEV